MFLLTGEKSENIARNHSNNCRGVQILRWKFNRKVRLKKQINF